MKKKKCCKENFLSLPFTSEHLFKTDDSPHHNPLYCKKYGKSHQEWIDEVLTKYEKYNSKVKKF